MFIAVRCPRCLLTVYTTFVADGALGFSVSSLTDEDLLFYNCPLRLCEYHIPTFHHVNFYFNPTNAMGMSHGFRVSPRTADTKPFRTPAQIAALAITFGYGGEGLRRPPAMAPQVHDKAQAAPEKQAVEEQETDREDNQDGAAVAPVADTRTAARRWTADDVDKLISLNSQGRPHNKIASELNRSIFGVQRKLASLREKGRLANGTERPE